MTWTAPRTFVTGELETASIFNTHLRDNILETAPAKVTTKGDSVWGTGANAIVRLGVGADGTFLIADSAEAAGVRWGTDLEISNSIFINEDTDTDLTIGLVINQGAADDAIVTLKSSDVAHGVTLEAETDTYGMISKESNTQGGLEIKGLTELQVGIELRSIFTTADTSKGNASVGGFQCITYQKNGASVSTPPADANLFTIWAGGNARWIVDAEGDTHRDGTSNTFDAYDDAQLIRAFMIETSPNSIVKDVFDRFLAYSRDDLIGAGILHESGFYNESALIRLLTDAAWQLSKKIKQLETAKDERISVLERDINRINKLLGGADV